MNYTPIVQSVFHIYINSLSEPLMRYHFVVELGSNRKLFHERRDTRAEKVYYDVAIVILKNELF